MQSVLELKQYIVKGSERYYSINYPNVNLENNFYYKGLVEQNDFTFNLDKYYALKVEIETFEEMELYCILNIVKNQSPRAEKHTFYSKNVVLPDKGIQEIILPIKEFSLPISQDYCLKFVRGILIKGNKSFNIKNICLIKGKSIALECDIKSKPAHNEEIIIYDVKIYNCEDKNQKITLERKTYGWETLEIIDMPRVIALKSYEIKDIKIKIKMSERVCEGGFENQTIIATPNGRGELSESITFTTIKYLPHPHVLLDEKELNEVKEKINKYDWAKNTYERWIDASVKWEVPSIDIDKSYLFVTRNAHEARGAATMYQLSGNRELGLKVVKFLKELSHPTKGYLRLPKACNQELVHEGEFFKSTAIAYDMVYDFPELTKEDHHNMEAVLRTAIEVFDGQLRKGEISNWTLAEICGGLYSACVLQDRQLIDRFLYGVGGAAEHLAKGTFSDGWWFEASIGYNLLCAGLFSEISQAVKHFGINFKDISVPANYSKSVASADIYKDGLSYDAWGPNNKNYRTIPMIWDSLIAYYDYRGVIFGINDSSEMKVEGISRTLYDPRFDMAYYLYQKQEYAQLMRNVACDNRDLLFGVGELPKIENEKVWNKSCYADNAGVAVLRSKKVGVEDREQIQVGVKYGSHGGAHGHYDRVSMTSLMRYGRALIGPENIWYSYHTFMYKFYVQNSVAHNMVIVDLKLQDPVEPKRLMFYTGQMIQAIALENYGKWSHPPYGGWTVGADKTFAERTWNEGRYVPIPEVTPEYTIRSEFTEDILTRRMTVITDDFVVNFDYAKGENEHNFDCLYHFQGLKSIDGMEYKQHTEQLETCPLSSAQFITDCNWYDIKHGGKLRFEVEYTEDKNNGNKWMSSNRTGFNECGIVKTDLYLAYPRQAEVIIGCDPEYQGVNKQLFYQVEVDKKVLAEGKFGAWILGKERLEIDIKGKKELVLKVKVNRVPFEDEIYLPTEKTIFWGNPQIELTDGTIVDLLDMILKYENIDMGNGVGIDYKGGPVKIQAETFDKAIPAEPLDIERESIITVDLDGISAKRLITSIGGDYPVGDESGRRRTIVFRKHEKSTKFVSVIEPVEDRHLINNVISTDGNSVSVFMKDGRVIEILVNGLEEEQCEPTVHIKEIKAGKVIREEYSNE